MEYININSVKAEFTTPKNIRQELLAKFDKITPDDYVITTDNLELLRGADLIEAARKKGDSLLPLRRASYIKETGDFPKRVILEVTSICNSDCSMCPRKALVRKRQHMDTDLCKKIIRVLSETGISGLWLMNLGEPLLHPDFFDIVDFCRSVGNLGPLWASTNGKIFNTEMQDKMLQRPVDFFNLSVNAMSKESYKKISPDLDFYETQNHFRAFIRRKRELNCSKPIVRAQMIEIPHVLDEFNAFRKEFGPLVDILAFNKLEKFSQDVEGNNIDGKLVTNTVIERCNRLERQDFIIFSDGSITCCDTDFNGRLVIGNLRENSMREIVNGDKYQRIMQQYRQGRLHENALCSRCRDYML